MTEATPDTPAKSDATKVVVAGRADEHVHEDAEEIVEVVEITDEEAAEIFGGLFEDAAEEDDGERKANVELRSRSGAQSFAFRKIDEEARTCEISLSSEAEVERWFGRELLVHSDKSVDLGFMRSGAAPLLLDHDQSRQIGVIETARLSPKDKKVRAKVRFSRSALGQEVFQDVVDGIRSCISVGYRVNRMEKDPSDDELYRVTSWSPLEASVVSVPADTSVGVGRSAPASPTIIATGSHEKGNRTMSNENNAGVVTDNTAPDLDKIRSDAAKDAARAARESITSIMDLGARHNKRDLAEKAIAEGKTVEEFRGELLDTLGGAPLENNDIGMSKKERKRFSLMRLTRALANPTNRAFQEQARMELEASEAAQEMRGYSGQGVTIPREVLSGWRSDVAVQKRDLNTSDDSDIIDEDFRGSEFIDVLRNSTSVMQAGARMLTGLEGNVAIPKKTAASSAGWIASEGGASSESEPTFGQVTMAPKVVGAFTDITRLMMQQSSLDIEALVRDDLARGIALAIDLGGLEGSGAAGQPTGILNTGGINTVSNFAAAVPTFAEMVSFETALAEDNALIGNLAYITDAATYGGLKTTSKDTGSGMFVLEGGEANGYPVVGSQQATAGNVYFGNYSDLLIGMWDGLDIIVDPFTASTSGTVRIVALQTVDVAVRHAVSFAVGNDGV